VTSTFPSALRFLFFFKSQKEYSRFVSDRKLKIVVEEDGESTAYAGNVKAAARSIAI
jgi:hypothetical protein